MIRCSVPGCGVRHYGRGYCQLHYSRWRRTGNPLQVRIGHRYVLQDLTERVTRNTVPEGDCLIYTEGRPSKSGHVLIGYLGGYTTVHRAVYLEAHGPFPEHLVVRHTCDRPRCVNLEHLVLGTVADNNRDRDDRGRHVTLRGSANGSSKLTEKDIPTIRRQLEEGTSTYAVARAFGVAQGTIWMIRAGRTWTHA